MNNQNRSTSDEIEAEKMGVISPDEKMNRAKELMKNLVLFCDDELANAILVKAGLIQAFEERFPEDTSILEENSKAVQIWHEDRNQQLIQVLELVIADLKIVE